MLIRTIENLDVKGKRVLLRVDFNVPLDKFDRIVDDRRIRESLPTIKYLEDQGARIILVSHLGRPKGKVDEKLRLEPVGRYLSRLLNHDVLVSREIIGEKIQYRVKHMEYGDIILLENIRFFPEEEKNDKNFAQKLASLAEIYINDAFGAAHRAHASTEGVGHFLPSYGGFLMEKEIRYLSEVLEKPAHPFFCFLGGVKISTKLELIENLIKRADKIILGGALVHTILAAKGIGIGKSLVEEDLIGEAKKLLQYENNGKLILPKDCVLGKDEKGKKLSRLSDFSDIKSDEAIFDIGPQTVADYKNLISQAKLIVWNGPMGLFEVPIYARGTNETARAIAKSKAQTIIGGGETLEAIKKLDLANKFSFISTGGGAMLEFLEGKKLPGIEVLKS
jgi:phosphoglycerate kinase